MTTRLAEDTRTAAKATIRRASAAARAAMDAFDAEILDQLAELYAAAAADLRAAIARYAGRDGSLRLEALQDLLAQANARLADLETARNALLTSGLNQAAVLGVAPFQPTAVSAALTQIADDAVRFVRGFVAADGLQLSDRLWRIDQGAREAVARAIQSAVIQGHSASAAVNEFLAAGQLPPRELFDKTLIANAQRIAGAAGDALLTGEGSARANALRVFRTELNRAHGEAYGLSAAQSPDFGGFRYLLSPGHPRPDICDLHSKANLYALGPGVYPDRERLPWPAHPNTLSYFEIVFIDEVSDEDRRTVETRTQWLARQSASLQADVLGGQKKRAAFAQGLLPEFEFTAPWRVVEQRLSNLGVDTAAL